MSRSGWTACLVVLSACGSAVPGGGPSLVRLASRGAAVGIGSSGDDLRTGWYPTEPALSPASVSAPDFGQLFSVSVDGQVWAQPLLANGALLVVTETNHVYALDPATGVALYQRALEPPWNPADVGCGDLVPTIGITGTPVIDDRDPQNVTAYFTTKTYATGTSGPAAIFMHAVDVPTLAERPGFPVQIQGTSDNQTNVSFDATHELQRPGLLMLGNTVYASFAGHCDVAPWKGWVVGVKSSGAITAMWAAEDQFNDGGGIWQSGGAPMSDGPGTFIVATGNGEVPPAPIPGNTPPNILGQAWVRLHVQGNGKLLATDFFMPYDAEALNVWDADFGSGGPMGLPDSFGTPAHPHLGVAAGKQGYVYLLDRDDLGGLGTGPGGGDRVVQRIGPYGGVWSRPAAWPGSGGWVYYPTASGGTTSEGSTGMLNVFAAGHDGQGMPTLSLVAMAPDAFGFGSSAPVVTSDGTTDGSALVWVVWMPDGSGAGAQLRAYDAVPESGTLNLRWSAPIGTGSKFNPPGIGDGRVYVGTRDAKVIGFGAPVNQPLAGTPLNLGTVQLGSSSSGTAVFTARRDTSVSALTSTNPDFALGTPSPPLPATLASGQTLSVPVTFTPSKAGIRAGALVAQTPDGPVSTSLSGIGQHPEPVLSVSPTTVSFGGTSVGQVLNGTVTLSNVGGGDLVINGILSPAAPFAATGLPGPGSTLSPGKSVTLSLSFSPTQVGNFVDNLHLDTTAGPADIPMSGTAALPGNLVVTPPGLDFGTVRVQQSQTLSFEVKNTGGTRVTVTKSKPPASNVGFTAPGNLNEGTTMDPGESKTLQVTFTPAVAGPASDKWTINADGQQGLLTVALSGVGATDPSGLGAKDGGCSSVPVGTLVWPLLAALPWIARRRRRRGD